VTRGYLGIGSNLGDRLANLSSAVRLLEEHAVEVVRSSRVYETDPVGGPPQGAFLNAVLEIEFNGTARELLDAARSVEEAMGRVRTERWGPRVIDVDILTFGDRHVDEPDLLIPHPRMHERGFVLIPLLELTADPPLPGGRRAADVRLGPDALGGVRPYAPPLATEAGAER
jgi:2-amino-4-hydroxy-6-hydroxymethyldihydropteridine diphosphokinase